MRVTCDGLLCAVFSRSQLDSVKQEGGYSLTKSKQCFVILNFHYLNLNKKDYLILGEFVGGLQLEADHKTRLLFLIGGLLKHSPAGNDMQLLCLSYKRLFESELYH